MTQALLTGLNRPEFRQVIAALAAFSVTVGPLCNGFDSGFGLAASYLVNAALLASLLLISPPPPIFWRWIAPVAGIALLAAIWLIIPLTPVGGMAGFISLAPDMALPQLLGFASGLAALISGALVGFRHVRTSLLDWLLLMACVGIILGVLAFQGGLNIGDDIWGAGREGRFAGTLGNSNVAGAFYGAIAILALTRILAGLKEKRDRRILLARARQVLHWLTLVLALGACAATASRAAMALTLAGVTGLMLASFGKGRNLKSTLVLSALCGVAAIVLFAGFSDLLLERSRDVSRASLERSMMVSRGLDMVQAAPLTGYGTGSFPSLNAATLTDPRTANALWTINSPHNILLRLALDGGIPYLCLLLAAALWIAFATARGFRRKGWDIISVGMLAAILAITGCAMVDIALDVPAMITFILFLAGILWGRALLQSLTRQTQPQVGVAGAHLSPA